MNWYTRRTEGGYRRKPKQEIRTVEPGGIGFLIGIANCGDAHEDIKHANLMAGAPKLLEALREAVHDCGCTIGERASGHVLECGAPAWQALIEKITSTEQGAWA